MTGFRISLRYWLFFFSFLFLQVLPYQISGQGVMETKVISPINTIAKMRGQQVYNRACVACHGFNGDGEGKAAKYLNPLPRDFTAGTYKFRSTPSGELPTDEDLFQTISNGVPRTFMPAWKDLLTIQERLYVVAYIKSFSNKFDKYTPATHIEIPNEPKVTSETIAEGKNLYMLFECWACHGARGRGDGKSSKTLKDDWGSKIQPFDFTVGKYKGGNENRNVYKTFSTGLNGTPMPSYAEVFLFGGDSVDDFANYREVYSENEVAALKAYLKSQPTEEAIGILTEDQQKKLIGVRSWSLVHFVKSLSKQAGFFHKLFVEDTEVTN